MDYLLKNLNLFSGTGNEALKNAAIWIAGNKDKIRGFSGRTSRNATRYDRKRS